MMTAMVGVKFMKHTLFLFVAASLFAASCATIEEIKAPAEETLVDMQFTASFGDEQTRTSLGSDGYSVLWQTGDKITVFSGGTGYEFTLKSKNTDGSVAVFEGKITPSSTYYAVYPADGSASIDSKGKITTSLKTTQTATSGSFAQNVNLAVGKCTGSAFKFYNVGAIMGITVKSDGVTKATLSSEDAVLSGGTAVIDYNSGSPTVSVSGGSYYVSLDGSFTKDKVYYFVVYPGNHTAFKLTFNDKDGNRAIYDNPKDCSIAVNKKISLGSITIPSTKWIGPVVDFLGKTAYGMYGSGKSTALFSYTQYSDQYVVGNGSSDNWFRIQRLVNSSSKYFQIKNIPSGAKAGDVFDVTVSQNWGIYDYDGTALAQDIVETVTVSKTSDGKMWLTSSDETHGYIVKQ